MKITILDFKKIKKDVKSNKKDFITLINYKTKRKKTYARLIKFSAKDKKYKAYYINEKDWHIAISIIGDMIRNETDRLYKDLENQKNNYRELWNQNYKLTETWYVKLGKWIDNILRIGR